MMPQLLELANEILLQIIEYTEVEDIDSFSSCNKRIRLLFEPMLQLHMEKKKKYSRIIVGSTSRTANSRYATTLLRDVYETPIIARYPTEITIRLPHHKGHWWDEVDATIVPWVDRMAADMESCSYIEGEDEIHNYKSQILTGDLSATAAFLLTLLPNIRSLCLCGEDSINKMIQVIARIKVHQQDEQQRATIPPQKLTSVFIGHVSGHVFLNTFEPLCKLPAMRKLQGSRILSYRRHWPIDPGRVCENHEMKIENADGTEIKDKGRCQDEDTNGNQDENNDDLHNNTGGSNTGVSRVCFKSSTIDAQSFDAIFTNTKTLRDFKYDYNPALDYHSVAWVPAAILQSLVFHASHSLVNLVLLGNGMKGPWSCRINNSHFSPSLLQHFQVLRSLCVQDGIFAEDDLMGNNHWACMRSPLETWSSIGMRWKIYRMVDVLPRSLERLTLFASFDDSTQTMGAFQDFAALKKVKVPRLDRIILAQGIQIDESVKLECENVGTSVISLPFVESFETVFLESEQK